MTVATEEKKSTYLTFQLADELYAVEVKNVREILDFRPITKVPRMPDFMCGVTNLRGSAVPVIDMRLKLGLEASEKRTETCIIVLEVAVGDESLAIGAMADAVREVFELDAESIEPAPRIGTGLDTDFIRGMGKQGDAFIIILDIARVFMSGELETVSSVSSTVQETSGEEAESLT